MSSISVLIVYKHVVMQGWWWVMYWVVVVNQMWLLIHYTGIAWMNIANSTFDGVVVTIVVIVVVVNIVAFVWVGYIWRPLVCMKGHFYLFVINRLKVGILDWTISDI